jgi:hypothetical protein
MGPKKDTKPAPTKKDEKKVDSSVEELPKTDLAKKTVEVLPKTDPVPVRNFSMSLLPRRKPYFKIEPTKPSRQCIIAHYNGVEVTGQPLSKIKLF